jgi:hypothetical protein
MFGVQLLSASLFGVILHLENIQNLIRSKKNPNQDYDNPYYPNMKFYILLCKIFF